MPRRSATADSVSLVGVAEHGRRIGQLTAVLVEARGKVAEIFEHACR